MSASEAGSCYPSRELRLLPSVRWRGDAEAMHAYVRDIMTTNVVTVRPDTPYRELAVMFREHRVSGFPVTFAVGGKQYVAVSTGTSLVSSSALRLTPELRPGNAANVFVFALP